MVPRHPIFDSPVYVEARASFIKELRARCPCRQVHVADLESVVLDASAATCMAPSVFDWDVRDSGAWMRAGCLLRRMFVCTREVR